MSFILFWALCAVGSGILMAFGAWWNIRAARLNPHAHVREDRVLTLKELLIGVILAAVPILNAIVILAMLVYIFSEIAPKIVLFGDER